MAWKDEIQEEANKVANANWASTLRDSMYTSLTKLANFYETILVELTPKIEEKAEAKTLEVLGGANSESVAAEVVLARENFITLDARLDDIDERIEINTNDLIKVNRARRDVLFQGKAELRSNATVLAATTGLNNADYDYYEIEYGVYSSSAGAYRTMPVARTFDTERQSGSALTFMDPTNRTVVGTAWVQVGSGPSAKLSLWCASTSYTTTTDSWLTNYHIIRVIGIKY